MALNGIKKTNEELESDYELLANLNSWLKPPDRGTVEIVYETIGEIEAAIEKLQKDMRNAENAAIDEIEKPRSNEAKKARNKVIDPFLDKIADLKADLAKYNAKRKKLEYRRDMYKAATWQHKQLNEF